MKKLITFLIMSLIITFSFGYLDLPAQAASTSNTDYYNSVLNRLSSIGILNTSLKSTFQKTPNSALTREEMAVMLVVASNLSGELANYKNINLFSDIKSNYALKAYINTAVRKGLMTAYPDKKFHSKNGVTYAQAISTLVKMLGYSDIDLSGIWPQNYLGKAKKLSLTNGISFNQNSNITKANFAKMLDKLLVTSIKKSSSSDTDKSFAESVGLFTEGIVLADSKTSQELYNNEIQTDKGIYNNATSAKLQVGKKYRLVLDGNDIVKVYQIYNTEKVVKVKSFDGNSVTYTINNQNITMTLPVNATYYYNGNKQNYENLQNILKSEQSINIGLNLNNASYEYAVIVDPQNSSLGTYTECIVLDTGDTSSKLETNQISTDKGIFELSNSSLKLQVGSKYGVYIKNDVINGIYKILNSTSKVNVLNADNLTVSNSLNGVTKALTLPQKTTYYYNGSKQSYDNLKNILNQSQIVYLGLSTDGNSYEYGVIKDLYDDSYGTYTQCVILDNSTTSSKLKSNQVLTNKGLYDVNSSVGKLELGCEYGAYVKSGAITAIGQKISTANSFTLSKFSGTTITYKADDNTYKAMTLPKNVTYYYNGKTVDYDSLPADFAIDTCILFSENPSNSLESYAVIYDPVYSKAQIASRETFLLGYLGSIQFKDYPTVIRNGSISSSTSIEALDVIYKVTDINGNNPYIMDIANKVDCKILSYTPSQLSPTSMTIYYFDTSTLKYVSKEYAISSDFDLSILQSKNFVINSYVNAIFDKDDKIVSLVY